MSSTHEEDSPKDGEQRRGRRSGRRRRRDREETPTDPPPPLLLPSVLQAPNLDRTLSPKSSLFRFESGVAFDVVSNEAKSPPRLRSGTSSKPTRYVRMVNRTPPDLGSLVRHCLSDLTYIECGRPVDGTGQSDPSGSESMCRSGRSQKEWVYLTLSPPASRPRKKADVGLSIWGYPSTGRVYARQVPPDLVGEAPLVGEANRGRSEDVAPPRLARRQHEGKVLLDELRRDA